MQEQKYGVAECFSFPFFGSVDAKKIRAAPAEASIFGNDTDSMDDTGKEDSFVDALGQEYVSLENSDA